MTKILLVEDNKLNREMFSRRLVRKGFEVITAGDGKEAVRMAEAERPELVLMDLSLPIMDGWQATQHLKASPVTQSIPVIALTAHAMVGDREKALSSGCDDYDTKPVNLQRLLQKIQTLLENTGTASPKPHPAAKREPNRIPAVAKAATSDSVPLPSAVRESPPQGNVLIVDDNPLNCEMLVRRLHREGYTVTATHSGREAINCMDAQNFDVILLDIMMPEMSGAEVLSIIRSRHTMLELPVIIVTAKQQTEDMVDLLRSGANDFLTKPFNFPLLLARLKHQIVLKQSRAPKHRVNEEAQKAIQRATALSQTPPADNHVDQGSAGSDEFRVQDSTPVDLPTYIEHGTHSVAVLDSGSASGGGTSAPGNEGHGSAHGDPSSKFDQPFLADYELVEELGRGGMGVVYKAWHKRMNRLVAIKLIDKEHLTNEGAIQRFYREVQAAAQLSHPNIVMAFDSGQFGDTNCLVMEYVEGEDLYDTVKKDGPLPVSVCCDYILQAAQGLQHAHENGFVHRDIKPSNLMVTSTNAAPKRTSSLSAEGNRVVKILDFGLALLYDADTTGDSQMDLTREGRIIGTADYMAPEQWMNAHKVDIRADLYSLGATFYFLLTGQIPFPSKESMEKMLKHHLDEPTPIEEVRPDVPVPIINIVRKLMAKKPADRYQTPEALADVLRSGS